MKWKILLFSVLCVASAVAQHVKQIDAGKVEALALEEKMKVEMIKSVLSQKNLKFSLVHHSSVGFGKVKGEQKKQLKRFTGADSVAGLADVYFTIEGTEQQVPNVKTVYVEKEFEGSISGLFCGPSQLQVLIHSAGELGVILTGEFGSTINVWQMTLVQSKEDRSLGDDIFVTGENEESNLLDLFEEDIFGEKVIKEKMVQFKQYERLFSTDKLSISNELTSHVLDYLSKQVKGYSNPFVGDFLAAKKVGRPPHEDFMLLQFYAINMLQEVPYRDKIKEDEMKRILNEASEAYQLVQKMVANKELSKDPFVISLEQVKTLLMHKAQVRGKAKNGKLPDFTKEQCEAEVKAFNAWLKSL